MTPNGAKYFIAEGRVNGRMRRFTIGSAERFTVNEARGRAKALLAGMHDGLDPQFKKRAARERSDTLQAMLEAYLTARGVKEATARQVSRTDAAQSFGLARQADRGNHSADGSSSVRNRRKAIHCRSEWRDARAQGSE